MTDRALGTLEQGEARQTGPPPDAPPFEMGRLGRHTVIYGLGMLMSKAVAFVMLPIYTRYLTPADYGVMELIEMTLDVIAIAAGARVAVGVFRYYHKVDTREQKNAVVSTALVILAGSYAVVATGAFLAAPLLSELVFGSAAQTGLIRLGAASLGFQSLIITPLAYIQVREKSWLFVIANLAKLVIALTLNVVLVVGQRMGVEGAFISSLVANAVVGACLAAYLVRQVGLRFSRAATRDLVRYGVPLMATQIATFLATFGDRYFLQQSADVTEVGVYSLAYRFGFLVAIIGYVPFSSVWEPARFDIARRADRDDVYARAFVLMNVLLVATTVGIVLFGGEVIRIMASPAFFSAGELIPILVVAYVVQSWTSFQDLGIHMVERTELITLGNWVCAGVALLGFWILIPRFLGVGAAVATVVAFGVRHVVIYEISQRLWPVRYDWRPVRTLVLLGLTAAVGSHAIPPEANVVIRLGVRACLFAAFLVAVLLTGVISPSERSGALSMARNAAARLPWRSSGRAHATAESKAGAD